MIRLYKESDFEQLCDISRRAWNNIFAGYREQLGDDVYETINPDPEHSKDKQLRYFADHSPQNFWVAERNGKVVGFINYYTDDTRKIGIFGNNAVDPDCGEKGVGQEMYQKVFELMREQGMKLVQVTTGFDAAHAPARRAYERAGFNLHTESITFVKEL